MVRPPHTDTTNNETSDETSDETSNETSGDVTQAPIETCGRTEIRHESGAAALASLGAVLADPNISPGLGSVEPFQPHNVPVF